MKWRIMQFLTIIILSLQAINIQSQQEDIFFVGHSLSDYIPEMLESFGEDKGPAIDYGYSQIIGSPLHYQWGCLADPSRWNGNFPDGKIYAFYDPVDGLPTGRYDHLVLNEGVPRLNNEWGIQETYRYVDSFYLYASEYRPDIRLYISELWHCLRSGTPTGCDYDEDSNPWRQRLDDDLPMWESAVDFINDKYQLQTKAILIPSGQALATFYDSIEAGKIQGIQHIDQVFEDDIHGNDTIRYLVACVNYASITKRSPIGLTNQPKRWWGGDFGYISRNLAVQLQTIAWQTVCQYPHNGISCHTTGTSVAQINGLSFYPNPSNGSVWFSVDAGTQIEVFSPDGVLIWRKSVLHGEQLFQLNNPPGMYLIRAQQGKNVTYERMIVH